MTGDGSGFAVVVEPHPPLAETVADCLRQRGYAVGIASTHAGGASLASDRGHVEFLAAAVPAPGEDCQGAYLEKARAENPDLAVVIMLSDPNEAAKDAPSHAVQIVKPFSLVEMADAIERAFARAGISRPV
jgi:DNA-binding response OmpR family regulator